MKKETSDTDPFLKGRFTFPDEYFREIFAAAALSGLLAQDLGPREPSAVANLAYQYADAMLAHAARRTTSR